MANIKISELDELQKATDQDLLVIVDVDNNKTKKIQAGNLGILVPKTEKTTSDTETYSCNYVNNEVDKLLPENSKTTGTTNTYSCDYINNAIDDSKLKSAILVVLSKNKSLTVSTAWSDIKIPFDIVLRKIGDGFSLNTSTGVITASENVKNVKISIGVRVNNEISGSIYPRIYSQSGISDFTESGNKTTGQIRNETIDKCDTSKTIQGGFRCSATGEVILMGTEQYTYMLVEEL